MKYLILIQGYDPTGSPTTPTNAELLQMVRESQFADDVGGIILSETAPDVATYDILRRFRWMEMYGSAPTGNFYYHDGSSWVIERPADGTVTGATIQDGTIGLEKLTPPGVPYYIIQATSTGLALQWVSLIDAIVDGTIGPEKFEVAAGANYMFVSGAGGVWEVQTAGDGFGNLTSALTLTSGFNSAADRIAFYNAADGTAYTLTVATFGKSLILSQSEVTVTSDNDYVLCFDTSTGFAGRVSLANLLPDTGVTAGAYTYPTALTVNSKGQLTAISSASSFLPSVGTSAFPAPGAAATIPHGLAGLPSLVRVVAQCLIANNGYAINDEVELYCIGWSASNTGLPAFSVSSDMTNVVVGCENNATPTNIFLHPKTGGAYFNFYTSAITSSEWQLKVYARL